MKRTTWGVVVCVTGWICQHGVGVGTGRVAGDWDMVVASMVGSVCKPRYSNKAGQQGESVLID